MRLGDKFFTHHIGEKKHNSMKIIKDIQCNMWKVPNKEQQKLKNFVLNHMNNYVIT